MLDAPSVVVPESRIAHTTPAETGREDRLCGLAEQEEQVQALTLANRAVSTRITQALLSERPAVASSGGA